MPPSHPYALAFGVIGALTTLVSLVLQTVREVSAGRVTVSPAGRSRVRGIVVLAGIGVLAEMLVIQVVTRHAFATAPLGYEYSGEQAAPIVELAVLQPVLVAGLALAWHRFDRAATADRRCAPRRGRAVTALVGLGGMVLGCTAFAMWAIHAGTSLVVNVDMIAGNSGVTNAGAWWPGLFSAMAALTIVVAACAPSLWWRPESDNSGPDPELATSAA